MFPGAGVLGLTTLAVLMLIAGLKVVVRQGHAHRVADLEKAGAARARAIIVLAYTDDEAAASGVKDIRALKVVLALRRVPGARGQRLSIGCVILRARCRCAHARTCRRGDAGG